MKGSGGYIVFFYPQALEVLGDAIKPYLQDGEAGTHLACSEIDTAGGFTEMTLFGKTSAGQDVTLELMVPSSMVRMIVSSQQDGSFGFRRQPAASPAATVTPSAAPAAELSGESIAAPQAPSRED
ncbi:hypothetical protein FZO89_03875 [Luteimonas viscosa]|uniref:Stringent starvation protein B n=1 Tax=Luteimonas viscosa TaxID=1132694 RepID=A0A5D4XLM7_9GAMM|nr:hypothetical protein [Luteimonas viscosa]TYT25469.1 hypothetical protein FZO89_03875 [Luteimonas viscosa]